MTTQQFWITRPPSLQPLRPQLPLVRPVRLLSMQRIFMFASQQTRGFAQRSQPSNKLQSNQTRADHSDCPRLFFISQKAWGRWEKVSKATTGPTVTNSSTQNF